MRIPDTPSAFRVAGLTLSVGGTALILAACSGGGGTEATCEVTAVTVSPQTPTVNVAQTVTLTGNVTHQNCTPAPTLTWSSNATGVASVSDEGIVTGVTPGTAQITAAAGGRNGSTTVTVQQVPVEAVIVLFTDPSLAVGRKTTVQVELRDDENQVITGREVRWSVSDMSKAIVPPGSDWTSCANENSTCTFTGTKQVRYGANGTYSYRELIGGTPCTNAVFTDPVPGVQKQCHIADLAKTVSGGAGLEVTAIAPGTLTLTATPVQNATPVTGSEQLTITPPVFANVAAGGWTTCATRTDGKTFCWGDEGLILPFGGDVAATIVPTLVSGSPVFVELALGGAHICGRTGAGAAWCWQNNYSGQLGDNTTEYRAQPTLVTGSLTYAGLSLGYGHTCGRAATGSTHCWGGNYSGGLGDGSTTQRHVPTAVQGGHAFADFAAGYGHTCGVTATGVAYCWGGNGEGQLGDNSITNRLAPVPVAGSVAFVELTAGFSFTCGRTAAGAAHCWGSNGGGQLGDNSTTERRVPGPVSGGLAFAELVAGASFACGRTAAGSAYCWGSGAEGHLGNNGTTNRHTPTAVSGGLSFVQLTAGDSHACGRTADGNVYCWGNNIAGQLGDGTTINRFVPTLVTIP